MKIISIFIFGFFLASCSLAQRLEPWGEKQTDSVLKRNIFEFSSGAKMPYRLYVPEGLTQEDKLPLLVFLHGRGDRGTDNRSEMFSGIRLFQGERSIVSPYMQSQFASIVLIPQCSDKTDDEEWANWDGNSPEQPFEGLGKDGSYPQSETPSESGAAALALIDHIADVYHVDKNRIYLTGVSMGGFGTWEFISRRPNLFAAAVPMAGFSKHADVEDIAHIPTWIFHGADDKWNPVEGSRIIYQLLTQQGADVQYTEYSNTGHMDTFDKAWSNVDLLPWVFNQKK